MHGARKAILPPPPSTAPQLGPENLGTTYESSKVSLGLRTLVVLVDRRGRAAHDVISRWLLSMRPVVMAEVMVEMVVVVVVVVAVAVAVAVLVTMAVAVAEAIAVLVTVPGAAFFGVSPSWEKGGQRVSIRFRFLEYVFINALHVNHPRKQGERKDNNAHGLRIHRWSWYMSWTLAVTSFSTMTPNTKPLVTLQNARSSAANQSSLGHEQINQGSSHHAFHLSCSALIIFRYWSSVNYFKTESCSWNFLKTTARFHLIFLPLHYPHPIHYKVLFTLSLQCLLHLSLRPLTPQRAGSHGFRPDFTLPSSLPRTCHHTELIVISPLSCFGSLEALG